MSEVQHAELRYEREQPDGVRRWRATAADGAWRLGVGVETFVQALDYMASERGGAWELVSASHDPASGHPCAVFRRRDPRGG